MSALILASPDERVKLLRAGITGKQIEKLFVELNHFKIVGAILYDPTAQPTNLKKQVTTIPCSTKSEASTNERATTPAGVARCVKEHKKR